MLRVLRAAYAPAFMFGFIGAALALVASGLPLAWLAALLGAASDSRARADDIWRPMTLSRTT
ncbi:MULTISPECIES: hypothetical protein [unclassified Phenylobacterium]|uniref:hypothetical protein n=1 Tax=unclassified Phenylobacterium TaxID=2640670 RepID=UPI00083B562F|nr:MULTISPECIES: hypothetical protein [unclassified Phenylobacterium]